MGAGELQEPELDSADRQHGHTGDVVLIYRDHMREQAGIDAHEGLDEGVQRRICKLDAVEVVPVDGEHDACRVVYLVGDAPVAGGLNVLYGVVGCSGVEPEVTDKLHQVKLVHRSGTVLICYVEETVDLLIDVGDVVETREGSPEYGVQPPQVGLVPQQHGP